MQFCGIYHNETILYVNWVVTHCWNWIKSAPEDNDLKFVLQIYKSLPKLAETLEPFRQLCK